MRKVIFGFNYNSPVNLLRMSYYAVAKGRVPGIYGTWAECQEQVNKYPGATFKKFGSKHEADEFIATRGGGSGGSRGSYSSWKQTSNTSSPSYKSYSSSSNRSQQSTSISSLGKRTRKPANNISKYFKSSDGNRIRPSSNDSDERVDIYCDGACSNNGQYGAKAGYGVFFGDNHSWNVARPVRGRATNNNAEIQAVTEAANIAKKNGLRKIKINTDSRFVISCIEDWMPRWERNGWKTSKGEPVINKTELIEMKKALSGLDCQFKHVRGHKGIHGNEQADKLAVLGAEYYDG